MNPSDRSERPGASPRPAPQDRIPICEWIVSGIGVAIVLGMLGFLLYKAFAVERQPARIAARVSEIIPQGEGSLVMAEVRNEGGKTVSQLSVIGAFEDEENEVVVDFIPARSVRRIGMFFRGSPSEEAIRIKIGAYQEP